MNPHRKEDLRISAAMVAGAALLAIGFGLFATTEADVISLLMMLGGLILIAAYPPLRVRREPLADDEGDEG